MQQFQAGYILEAVRENLLSFAKINNRELELNGLLRSLCTFNVQTNVNLESTSSVRSIFAVATNILTRGLPTLSNINTEQFFADALNVTHRIDLNDKGKVTFPFKNELNLKTLENNFFTALHTIDPRAKNRPKYLDVSNTDSAFERNFLFQLITEKYSFLTQLLEKQRPRNSFTRDNNQGRVDFSLEIPYDIKRDRINRYNAKVQTKHHKNYIVEIDGEKYHTDLLDDRKDFEIAQLSNNVKHITEDNVHQDVHEFIKSICSENFVKLSQQNFESKTYLTDENAVLVLVPFGIARIERVLLQYLTANFDNIDSAKPLNIAIIERDMPCAFAALEDLNDLMNTINNLAEKQIKIPEIKLEVFCSEEFLNHPLHIGNKVKRIEEINSKSFDLVIDISMLRREGVFIEDLKNEANTIIIRNSHFIHSKTNTGVISAQAIKYKDIVKQLPNEIYEPIEENSDLLKKILQNIFRKIDFREGQLPILNRALQLKSVIGLLPTGGGKSLTYQLAAFLQPGTTVVIDPIRSLMIDQFNGLKEIGIDKCEYINSKLSSAERNYNQNELLANGQLQFIFVSPERFVIDDFRIALNNATNDGHYFSYAVIDEVHCVSEWGHDFRTPYLNLGDNAQEFCITDNSKRPIPLFGLTATASFDVLADIERELNIKENDGNAVVRFENSVRDEINYCINEVPCTFEGLENLDARALRETIGKEKQNAIYDLIGRKEKILNGFNNEKSITGILKNSYDDYLPLSIKEKYVARGKENNLEPFQIYKTQLFDKLFIKNNPFEIKSENEIDSYNYGLIVFTPHRKGWLGIQNSYSSYGVFGNPEHVHSLPQGKLILHKSENETLGYFMGSGDDDNADKVDEESFQHLDAFKDNTESLMIATKAFGMGIDKPNVRMTIHINIPQSIESFVQEAGRSGRDGKISAAVILFNNDLINLKTNSKEPFHLDKDVLMYFHKNSFKGQVKERVMIFELRSKITFPNTNNLQMLTDQLNTFYGTDSIQFVVKNGGTNHPNRIFINTLSGTGIGFVYTDNQNTGIYKALGDDAFCYELVEWLKSKLPFDTHLGAASITRWLYQLVVNTEYQIGLERMLTDMNVGETKKIPVPFFNKYYSKRTNIKRDFILNNAHFEKVIGIKSIKTLIDENSIQKEVFQNLLKEAVFDGTDYPEFIESLKLKNEELEQRLLNIDDELALELQRAYFLPRSQEDTAKAIYRLITIEIIDSYTIDYQNKLYYITFTKKKENQYYKSLENVVARYSSKNVAKRDIDKLKNETKNDLKDGKATAMSVCLEYLTNFIYSKIKEKRLQAIQDMVSLCQTSIKIEDLFEQNKYVKDEIYYYFNAKYSRFGYQEKWVEKNKQGKLIEQSIQASLPDDLRDDLSIQETIDKYIDLIENEHTGEFISNIKHLRGSAMRMLRSNPDKPDYRILKAFSLFIMADSIFSLIDEAKEELVKGLIYWKENENRKLNVEEFIITFKNKIKYHILNYDVEEAFEDIEDLFYAQYYHSWVKEFNVKFIDKIKI
jgi:ATP-dependent DNA helicase RecQ